MAADRDLPAVELRAAAVIPGKMMESYHGGDSGQGLEKSEQGIAFFGMGMGIYHFKGQDIPSFLQRKSPDVVQGACQDDFFQFGGREGHFLPDTVSYGRNLFVMAHHGWIDKVHGV
jgi:hypothetical protein